MNRKTFSLCFILLAAAMLQAQVEPRASAVPSFPVRYASAADSLALRRLSLLAEQFYLKQRMYLTQAQFFTAQDTAYALADSALKWARGKIRGGDHPDLARSLHHMGVICHGRQRSDQAEALYLEALAMGRRMYQAPHADVEATVSKLALFYYYQNRYAEAEAFYLEAIALNRALYPGDRPALAVALRNLSLLYREQKRDRESEQVIWEAIAMQRRLYPEGDEELIWSVRETGFFYNDRGRFSEAEPLFREVLDMQRRIYKGDHPNLAVSLDNLAKFYGAQGRYRQAESFQREGLAMRRRLYRGDHPGLAVSLGGAAGLYHDVGRYDVAESLYVESLRMHRRIYKSDNAHLATSIRSMGLFYRARGRYDEAEALYKEALAMDRRLAQDNEPSVAVGLNNLGALYYYQGRAQEAESLMVAALQLRRRLYHTGHPLLASSLGNLAKIYERRGREAEAEALHREALAMRRKLYQNDHPDLVTSLNLLADFYDRTGRGAEAEPLFREALAMCRRLFGVGHANLINAEALSARFLARHNRAREAKPLYDEMLAGVNAAMAQSFGFESEARQLSFVNTILKPYLNAYAQFCVEHVAQLPELGGDYFNALLRFKGAIARESRRLSAELAQDPRAAELDRELTRLREREAWFVGRVQDSLARQTRAQIHQRADSVEAALRRLDKNYRRLRANQEASWQEAQRELGKNEALIEFSVAQPASSQSESNDAALYVAALLRGRGLPQIIRLCREDTLAKYLSPEINAEEDSYLVEAKQAQRLYALVWGPLEKMLEGVERIYLVPDGALHRLAFGALVAKESAGARLYLEERYDLRQLTSGRDLLMRERQEEAAQKFVLLGAPDFSLDSASHKDAVWALGSEVSEPAVAWRGDYEEQRGRAWLPLPGAARELARISALCRSQNIPHEAFTGREALEERVKQLSHASPRVLHLATHGFFYRVQRFNPAEPGKLVEAAGAERRLRFEENPMLRAGLVLAGANRVWSGGPEIAGVEDGVLTAFEVSRLNLSRTELVTLSACQTGLGEVTNGEGVFGLQRAFRVAGARALLMSLWKIDDEATAKMMSLFYSAWLAGKNKAEAFKHARQEMRKKYPQPYFWAAFVLVGV